MNKKIISVLGLLVIIGIIMWGITKYKGGDSAEVSMTSTSTLTTSTSIDGGVKNGTKPAGTKPGTGGIVIGSGDKKTYANSEYGFKIQYPKNLNQVYGYSSFENIPMTWRVNPSPANQGKAVISIPVFQVNQGSVATGKNYPLYFDAETRIGVSPNVKACYDKDSGYTDQTVTVVTINGVAWKRFDFSDAAMMKYLQGESYRTIHGDKCYVVEAVRVGSTYRDDTMKPGISQASLDGYFATARSIAYSFVFTK